MTINRINITFSISWIAMYFMLGLIAFKVLQLELSQGHGAELLMSSYRQAEHLRQTSDDLTRMARTYVVTGNPIYKEHYYQILDIRNGKFPRPKNYNSTFWYTQIDTNSQQLTDFHTSEPISWAEIIDQVEMKNTELALLRLAQKRSDKLVQIEEKAFAAMQGLFDDGYGHFTKLGPVDQDFAMRILYDKNYQQAKKSIMEPIQQFVSLVEANGLKQSNSVHQQMLDAIILGISLIVFSIITSIILSVYTRKKIILPLSHLECVAKSIASGQYTQRAKVNAKNELRSLANSINAMASAMNSKIEQFKSLSITDALTGLNNRHRFDEIMHQEIERVQRYGTRVSLLMIDIDHFKNVNDTFGHQKGDMVLRKIGHILRECVRSVDIPCRYGGEELTIIMPESDGEEALKMAERIRQTIAKTDFRENAEGPEIVTVSIGVAGCPTKSCTLPEFVHAADSALYEAKGSGRNRVCSAMPQ